MHSLEKDSLMFTGIVTDIGLIKDVKILNGGIRFRIAYNSDLKSFSIGASICCSGVCLTIVAMSSRKEEKLWFEVEAWEESLRLTTISSWKIGTYINLERSLKLNEEINGHLVTGHVDGLGKIISIAHEGFARRFIIESPDSLKCFIAPKGSICLNGTSLTINNVYNNSFDVLLIQHTLSVTTWKNCKPGDSINIEVDQIARYVFRMLNFKN